MAPSILFRCDASREMGGGHVMRCLALAQALAARGCDVSFACAAGTADAVWALGASGFRLIELADPFDAAEVVAKGGSGHHAMVVDHYGLAAPYEREFRRIAAQVVVIDDLVDRAHDCDLLIDQSLGRAPGAYRDLVPPHAVALAGSSFAMVRPEFVQARAAALARHRVEAPGRRVLVSLGLTDIGGISDQVTRALLARCPDVEVDVVIGSAAPSRAPLEALAAETARLRVHIETTRIAELMTEADLAIGAGGTTSWERCCLGLPTVLLVLADNQAEVARRLDEAGAAVSVTGASAAAEAAHRLLASPEDRARMAASAAAIVDGRGTSRIADRILGAAEAHAQEPAYTAVRLDEADAETIWLWRNDPATRAVSLTQAPILWHDHVRWLGRTLADADALNLLVSRDGVAVGTVRFALVADRTAALVSINLDPAMRGRGIGRPTLASALAHHDLVPLTAALVADIALDNVGSVAIFEACGFHRTSDPESGRFARFRRPAMNHVER